MRIKNAHLWYTTTHVSSYSTETMSEIYDIEELPEGKCMITFKITDRYQRKYPRLMYKFNPYSTMITSLRYHALQW